jgi:hypothetical protein
LSSLGLFVSDEAKKLYDVGSSSDALAVTFHTHKSNAAIDVIPIAVSIIVICVVVAVTSIVVFVFRCQNYQNFFLPSSLKTHLRGRRFVAENGSSDDG